MHTFRRLPELVGILLFAVAGLGFFIFTNPASLPPSALMLAFFIVYGAVYFILKLAFRVARVRNKLSPVMYKGVLIGGAALPVLLLALQSLGQLTARDTITLAILYVGGYFYLSRTVSPRSNTNA